MINNYLLIIIINNNQKLVIIINHKISIIALMDPQNNLVGLRDWKIKQDLEIVFEEGYLVMEN